MSTASGCAVSTASACPPRPRVASRWTLGPLSGRSNTGAISSRQRSSRTGTCVPLLSATATPMLHPYARRFVVLSDPHPLLVPGAGEGVPGPKADEDLTARLKAPWKDTFLDS